MSDGAPPARGIGTSSSSWIPVAIACAIGGLACLYLVRDYDALFHLAAGRVLLETGDPSTADPFSFTYRGATWHNHSPVYQALLAGLERLSGMAGLSIAQALLAVVLIAVPLIRLRATSGGAGLYAAAGVLLIAVVSLRGVVSPRPHVAGWLLLQVSIIALHSLERRRSHAGLWSLVGLYVLWLGTHGSHPLLLGLLTLHAGAALWGRRWRRAGHLGGVVAACVAAALLLKPGALNLATDHLTSQFLSVYTPEWQSIRIGDLFGSTTGLSTLLVWLASVMSMVATADFARGSDALRARIAPVPRHHTLALIGLQIFSLTSYRMLPLFLIGAAPLWLPGFAALAAVAADSAKGWAGRAFGALRRPAVAAVLLAALGSGWWWGVDREMRDWRFGAGLDESLFPIEAVAFMKEQGIGGRVYNAFNWGGYLMIERYPAAGVFVDGRSVTLYPPEFLAAFAQAYEDFRIFERLAAHFRVDTVLMPIESLRTGGLIGYLDRHPGWERVYRDRKAVLFRRLNDR